MAGFTGDHLDLEFGEVQRVEVMTVGGEVTVTAGALPVRVTGHVERGEPLEVSLHEGTLRVVHPMPERTIVRLLRGESPEAAVTIVAPADVEVSVRTVGADMVVAGFAGEPALTTVSGGVTVSEVGGLRVTSVSGSVEAQGVQGPVSANTVSGDVTITGGRLGATAVKAVSADVALDVDALGECTITTVSGTVALRLPDDARLGLHAGTVSGRLDCAFALADSVSSRRKLSGAIGGGGAEVRMRTVSGDVAVLRRTMAER